MGGEDQRYDLELASTPPPPCRCPSRSGPPRAVLRPVLDTPCRPRCRARKDGTARNGPCQETAPCHGSHQNAQISENMNIVTKLACLNDVLKHAFRSRTSSGPIKHHPSRNFWNSWSIVLSNCLDSSVGGTSTSRSTMPSWVVAVP